MTSARKVDTQEAEAARLRDLLAASEARHALILESATDYAIITTDLVGRITGWNIGAHNVLGWQEAEALGQPARLFFTPEDRAAEVPEKEMERVRTQGRASDDRWHLRRDGSRFWASGLMMPLRHERGQLQGYFKMLRDRTEQRRAEEALRAAAAEKDLLVAEVHHRVRNSLQLVQNLLTLQARAAEDAATATQLGESAGRVQTIAAIHEQLYRSGAALDADGARDGVGRGRSPGRVAMMVAVRRCGVVGPAGPARARAFRRAAGALLLLLIAAAVACASLPDAAAAAEQSKSASPMAARIKALIPDLEAQITRGMKAFDVPGLAIGIVTGDRLVYAKGFGVRSKSGGEPVDTRAVFQIGSVTKGFLATTMAIAVDQGKFKWDDRVINLYPDFRLKDPWVTREFRMFDLMAQRSGLPPYVNDIWATFGFDAPALIRSLRNVEPVSSFRTTFAYINITELLAGRIVAERDGLPDWNDVVQKSDPQSAGHDGNDLQCGGDRGRSRPRPRLSIYAGRLDRGAIYTVVPLRHWGYGRHQLQRRRHGSLAPIAAREGQLRGPAGRVA